VIHDKRKKISKTFLNVKKSNSKFQNQGYFGKNNSANLLKLQSSLVYRKVMNDISAKTFQNFR